MTYFTARSNLVTQAFLWEKMKTVDFSEAIADSDLKVSLYLKAFIKKMVQIGTVASEKIRLEFLYVHDLGPNHRRKKYIGFFLFSQNLAS